MKSFFKTALACLVGVLVAGFISTAFYTCTFITMISALSSTETTSTQEGDVLVLKIEGPVSEVESDMPFNFDMMSGFALNNTLSLRQICQAIDIAKEDKNIAGIYLCTDGMQAAPATYSAIRAKLADFKSSTGKFIIAYNDSYSNAQYYLGTVADSIYLNPLGTIDFNGLSSLTPYYKGLLEKIGVEMQIFRVGTFKSAVEPAMLEHMSDANRLQTETYLKSIWQTMTEQIAASRNLTVEQLDALADEGVAYMQPEEIFATGLVTAPKYRSEMEALLESLTGKDFHGITAKQLVSGQLASSPMDSRPQIAVLYASGEIVSSEADAQNNIWYKNLIPEIEKLEEDDNVKAVVLRVNSPGGSAFASEQIWKALSDLKAAGKPLIVSMGDYAASGGYYISCLADRIFAEPTTLTGSIGVFGMIPNFSSLTTGKLGINFEEVKTHKLGTLTTFRGATPVEKAKIQKGIEHFYDFFLTRCAEGRNTSKDSIAIVAEGRVWTGRNALEIGLVDELGGLDAAIAAAATAAQLDAKDCLIKKYPSAEEGLENLMKQFTDEATLRIADYVLGTDHNVIDFLQRLKREDRMQARCFEQIAL